jgi:hypothetical protein
MADSAGGLTTRNSVQLAVLYSTGSRQALEDTPGTNQGLTSDSDFAWAAIPERSADGQR